MRQANLALRFLLELAGIVAVGIWGYELASGPLRWVLALGAPAVMIMLWARLIAPRAKIGIDQRVRIVIGSAVLLLAAGLFATTGAMTAAVAFAALIVLNTVLLFILGTEFTAAGR
jgi:hypothetical protein